MNLGFNKAFIPKIESGQKIHTFREDTTNRWNTGTLIHYCTGQRSIHYNCFKKGNCTGVQKITIIPQGWIVPLVTARLPQVFIDGIELKGFNVPQLIHNDGFDSIEQFCDWFTKPFNGKIIHWTDFKY